MNSQVTLERRPVMVLGDISRTMRPNTIKQTAQVGTALSTARVAAVDIRDSTSAHCESSVTRQFDLASRYADRLSKSLQKANADRDHSDRTLVDRSRCSALFADSAAGMLTVIIVVSLDRLSREMTDLHSAYRGLIRLGVEIHEVDAIWINPISLPLKELRAVNDRKRMLERTWRTGGSRPSLSTVTGESPASIARADTRLG